MFYQANNSLLGKTGELIFYQVNNSPPCKGGVDHMSEAIVRRGGKIDFTTLFHNPLHGYLSLPRVIHVSNQTK
jgi:hypothetical protein